MKRLGSVARRPKERGEFLPPIFRPLSEKGINLRMGTASMIAGPPGAMKTGFALYWAARSGKRTLYMSADSEDFEMLERAGAMVSGQPQSEVRRDPQKYAEMLDRINMRFVFEDAPTYKDLELEVAAYTETYGDFPEIIVVDNLLNVTGDNEDEWASMRETSRVIHRLTRITGAALIVLHHMRETSNKPHPEPRSSVEGRVSHLPKLILSVLLDGEGFKVAPVKNRFGPADRTGQTYATIHCSPNTMQFFNSRHDQMTGQAA